MRSLARGVAISMGWERFVLIRAIGAFQGCCNGFQSELMPRAFVRALSASAGLGGVLRPGPVSR
ncbi:MAG TPA: hypothetical protein VI728_01825 [Syntrophales bacterium]|nr:hypothetical protein [Syntrophales bacterium]